MTGQERNRPTVAFETEDLADIPVFELGDAKVTDFCAPTAAQQHVGRLEIPTKPPRHFTSLFSR